MDAIHLKDWREDVGRSYQFYARGFCELGDGDIPLEDVLNVLLQSGFSGWIVVELDWTSDPPASASKSLRWLQARLSTQRPNAEP
jgi:sugar phosphate isomerase/epimerase